MRRLVRWTLNAATIVSLALCVATVALWVRSHFVFESLTFTDANDRTVRIYFWPGRLCIGTVDIPDFPTPGWHRRTEPVRDWADPVAYLDSNYGPHRDVHLGIFRWFSGDLYGLHSIHVAVLIIPDATVAAVFALFPLIWLAHRLASRRRVRRVVFSRCRFCSYDLTANLSGVCPECGTPVTRPAPPASAPVQSNEYPPKNSSTGRPPSS